MKLSARVQISLVKVDFVQILVSKLSDILI